MNFKLWVLGIIILAVLAACSEEKEAATTEKTVQPVIENVEDLGENPPALNVMVDGMEISSIRSGYSWSYFDEQENAMALVETESLSPMELAENQKAPAVSGTAVIDLDFEKEPDSYEVQIWNGDGVGRGIYKEVVLHESSGRTVYQVIAHWEQGTVRYIFALMIE